MICALKNDGVNKWIKTDRWLCFSLLWLRTAYMMKWHLSRKLITKCRSDPGKCLGEEFQGKGTVRAEGKHVPKNSKEGLQQRKQESGGKGQESHGRRFRFLVQHIRSLEYQSPPRRKAEQTENQQCFSHPSENWDHKLNHQPETWRQVKYKESQFIVSRNHSHHQTLLATFKGKLIPRDRVWTNLINKSGWPSLGGWGAHASVFLIQEP